ncbi:MAG: hypothetical protein J0M08_06790 [Bacteroidetes bacterium]|nr:hypothetical protein [Bacteroidota bacterium]
MSFILLQYTNANTTHGGITNITALYNAALSASGDIQRISLPLVGLAVLLHFFIITTKILTGQREFDFLSSGKLFLLLLFLTNYSEVMGWINEIIHYFTDAIDHKFMNWSSGKSITEIYSGFQQEYKAKYGEPSMFDNFTEYLILGVTHLTILVSRSIIYSIRELYMAFLLAVGPLAVLISMFPGFGSNIGNFIRYYFSVAFWAITLAVLDLLLYKYLENCASTNDKEGFFAVNIGMCICYIAAPYLTGRYVSGMASQFMSKFAQSGTSMGRFAGQLASGAAPMAGQAIRGTTSAMGSMADKGGLSRTAQVLKGEKSLGKAAGEGVNALKQNFSAIRNQIKTNQGG